MSVVASADYLRVREQDNILRLAFPQPGSAGFLYNTEVGGVPSPVDIIDKVKQGREMTVAEVAGLVRGFTAGEIPDYQMAAWLMAVCLRGLTMEETLALTLAMADSGRRLDLSSVPGLKVDKHSTGGVADTTTLAVVPLAAAGGVPVAKMSGRGLGFTGGTIDKLSAIRGFDTALPPDRFVALLRQYGLAITGQTPDIAPADGKIYALRDVTATVDSIPLIASSIMSKKLAAGADRILLDVKVGCGAFMHSLDDAIKLAQTMVHIGMACQRETVALITAMDEPLGQAIGNALEVQEAVAVLQGRGPKALTSVCLTLAGYLLTLGGQARDAAAGYRRARELLASGAALNKFRAWVTAQGGDPAFIVRPDLLPQARYRAMITAPASGYITHLDAAGCGRVAMLLGAGRRRKDDVIDLAAGVVLHCRRGDKVLVGQPLLALFTNDAALLPAAEALGCQTVAIGSSPPAPAPLIYGVVDEHGFRRLTDENFNMK